MDKTGGKNHSELNNPGPDRLNTDGYSSLAVCAYLEVLIQLKHRKI